VELGSITGRALSGSLIQVSMLFSARFNLPLSRNPCLVPQFVLNQILVGDLEGHDNFMIYARVKEQDNQVVSRPRRAVGTPGAGEEPSIPRRSTRAAPGSPRNRKGGVVGLPGTGSRRCRCIRKNKSTDPPVTDYVTRAVYKIEMHSAQCRIRSFSCPLKTLTCAAGGTVTPCGSHGSWESGPACPEQEVRPPRRASASAQRLVPPAHSS